MTRRIINTALAGAAVIAAGSTGPAPAQPRLEQTGDGYSVAYDGAERGNVAGGRIARLESGGEEAVILYTGPDPMREGRSALLSGGGDDAVISYAEPDAAAPASSVADRATARGAGRRG